ncbi:MFS transporter [Leifsonia poae]|uniref:MFS transporter n=1 Tax=Leifsonia poae TaxID=110933 RepID=UPI001CBE77FC|nr:MFS transporter [Leifsonia poae]
MTTPTPPSTRLIRETGFTYFPLAIVARLPFAMMVVGVLTLVVSARDSLSLGGFNSAMVGLGAACFGPLLGAAADRFGQRPVLLISGAANSAMLVLLAWVVYSTLPDAAVFAVSFLIGATAPQVSPMSRSRLVTIIAHRLAPARRERVFNSTMAYESAADEVVFIFGPFLVGVLATTLNPWAPVVGGAVLTLFFVSGFALHRTSVPAKSAAERAASLGPARELVRPALVVVVVGIFGVGLFFGAMLTSLTAFMTVYGHPEQAGLVYGVMGIGSAAFALGVALFPERFTRRARWLVFSVILFAGTLTLQLVGSVPGMMLALLAIGIGIGPTLVTQYSFGAERSPVGRSATVMTILGSAVIVGQSASSAFTGQFAEADGAAAALIVPSVAAGLVVLTGVVNWFLSRPNGAQAAADEELLEAEPAGSETLAPDQVPG